MERTRLRALGVAVAGVVACALSARAYDRYSVNGDATNCRSCHGDFRANGYVSRHDGQAWSVTFSGQTYTSLHDVHRRVMVNGDCSVCHGGSTFPVFTGSSTGGVGFQPISCAGCHGRAGDHNPPASRYSAGLRQHHYRNSVTVCANCHDDGLPTTYTPVRESLKPPYYFTPDVNHPNKPTDPCNPGGVGENVAGGPTGLDNDGNNVYDTADCAATAFYTVTPCRVFDTREPSGPTLGAPLTCGIPQSFTVVGKCGVPSSAKAVSLNLAGTASTAQGNLRVFPAGAGVPLISTLNYTAGLTRANNAVAALGTAGQISVLCSPTGTTHAILDVNGYFE